MIQLVPMTNAEYDSFMEVSMREQAEGQVRAGTWQAEEADEMIRNLCDQFLPHGMATPNHFFFMIQDEDSGKKVGEFWYTIMEQDGKRQLFVMDIRIYDEHRRRGYATQAFQMMEEQAREMGITTISLHVFKFNHSARAMYQKLGYVGEEEMMSMDLGFE